MPKFKLEGGDHAVGMHKVFKNGSVIESELDLVTMFPGKFRQVEDSTPVFNRLAAPLPKGKDAPPSELNSVTNVSPDAMLQPGITTTDPEAPTHVPVPTTLAPAQETEPEGQKVEGQARDPEQPLGEDVTQEFKGAKEAGLVIFKDETGYAVYDSDSQNAKINQDPLTSKTKLKAFLSEYVKE